PGTPDMLTIRSGFLSEWSRVLLENWPSEEMPRSRRTRCVVLSMKPSGWTPALSAEMMSEASWRAIASAIWLRTQLPMHTKRTFIGSGMGYDALFAMLRKYSWMDGSALSSG